MLNCHPCIEITKFPSSSGYKTIFYIKWQQIDDITSFQMSESEFKKTLVECKDDPFISFKYIPYSSMERDVNYKKLMLNFFLGSKSEKFFNKDDFLGREYWTNDPPEMNLSLIKQQLHPMEWRPERLYKDTDIYSEINLALKKGIFKYPKQVFHPQPINYDKTAKK